MSGSEDVYTSTMLKRFGYLATWYPGTQLGLGLIGVLEGKTFVPKSSIRTLGVRFATTKDPSTDKKLQFKSSKSVQLHTKLKGAVSNIAPSIPKARAGVAISFGKETGVVFSANGIGATRIADVLALEDAIWDLWDRFLWDESWIVVTELLSAKKTTILVSEGGESKVELQVSGSAKAGPIDIGDLAAGFRVVSSSGMHTQIVGESGMTPLFRGIRVRKSFWQGTRIEAARAPAVAPAPGRPARRGRARPRATMTEIVKD